MNFAFQAVEKTQGFIEDVDQLGIKMSNFISDNSGSFLGHYEKADIKTLGEGSFGEVYKVRHKTSGLIRAMKVIKKPKDKINNQNFDRQIKNEIEILRRIDHPNIVKIYEFYVTKTEFQIIMEYCPHGQLYKYLKERKKMSEQSVAYILYQLLMSLNYCHTKGIIHRDIKPQNILITEEKGNVGIKVCDFGTAQVVNKNISLRMIVGSCDYMAPEVLNKKYDFKCDLWSCGVIMYMLLSHRHPFPGKTETDVFNAVRKGKFDMDIPEFSKISASGKDLIEKMLTKEPEDRISAEEALDHKWFVETKTKQSFMNVNKKAIKRYLDNILKGGNINKLQMAAIALIFHQLPEKSEVKEVYKVFRYFDINSDGQITKEELFKSLTGVFSAAEAEDMVQKIFDVVDNDGSGTIEYEEFARASIDRKILLKQEYLKMVFQFFDQKATGYIDMDEIKEAFTAKEIQIGDEVVKQMLREADEDDNNTIEYPEFEKLMKRILR